MPITDYWLVRDSFTSPSPMPSHTERSTSTQKADCNTSVTLLRFAAVNFSSLEMVENQTPSGGSRASKKRRKSNSGPVEEPASVQKGHTSKSENSEITPVAKKSPKFSADSLSRASLELDNAASAATPSSSSTVISKSREELLKLSIKEVLSLEEVVDVDCPTRAAAVLSIILSPFDRSTFYSDYWEKRPMHCGSTDDKKRNIRGLLSSKQFRNILKSQSLVYGLDVTTSKMKADYSSMLSGSTPSEIDQEKLVEAKESELLQHFEEGFCIRLTCPQKYHDPLWSLLSVLEFEFGSRVGCRVELLPPNGSGFKPKYENFDSIIVQLDGQSWWRLYSSLEGHELPRCPSYEIEVSDLPGVVSLDTVLNPGDSLYIPKGWTHRVVNSTAETSMFLTIQVNESNSVADLFEAVMPEALAEAIEKSTDIRRSLPRAFHSFMGVASSENDSDPLRQQFEGYSRTLLMTVMEEAMNLLDAAADQNAKAFLAARLPIPLTADEESKSAAGAPSALIYPYTLLRMIRPNVARCVVETGMVVVYHCMDNSRELHGAPLQPLEFELDDGPAIEALLAAYPEAILVSELPHPSEELEDKIALAQVLYKEGFLLIYDEASKPDNDEDEVDDDNPF